MSAHVEIESGPPRPPGLSDRLLEILDLGIPEQSVPADEMRRIRILSGTTLLMIAVGAGFVLRHFELGIYEMCIALLGTMGVALANLALLRATRRTTVCAHIGISVLTAMLIFSNYITGGFNSASLAWLYLVPICAAVILDVRGAALWTLAILGITFGFWLLPELGIELVNRIPEESRAVQDLFNRMTAIIAIGLIGGSFVATQRRAERDLARANSDLSRETAYVQLLQDAAVSANQAASLDEAMRDSLARICTTMGWAVGHIYDVMEDGRIVSTGFSFAADPDRFGGLAEMTVGRTFEVGEGLPGRAAATGKPHCVHDFRFARGLGRRAKLAESAGLRSGFAVPVLVNEHVRSVLEFGHSEPLPHDERLSEVFAHIGEELGQVAERTALQDRVRQSQKMEAVGQLAAGLAHEINNPMSYVRSNLHLIHDGWKRMRSTLAAGAEGLEEELDLREFEELIGDSIDGVERTIAIVRDVKEFSRFGGGGTASWTTADLAELIEGAVRVAAHQSTEALAFERRYEPVPEIVGSPNQLRQVFVNLIVNAVQAVGGEGTIRLEIARDGDQVVARIADAGPGMSDETRERLFDPFYTTKPPGEGTGLGLYVSYEIVRGHGGEIIVSSEPGYGTTFEVRLPIEHWPGEDSF